MEGVARLLMVGIEVSIERQSGALFAPLLPVVVASMVRPAEHQSSPQVPLCRVQRHANEEHGPRDYTGYSWPVGRRDSPWRPHHSYQIYPRLNALR